MHVCRNNSENLSTTKVNKYIACSYSIFTKYAFDNRKNKYDCYRGKYYMKKSCKDLKEHTVKLSIMKKRNEIVNKQRT